MDDSRHSLEALAAEESELRFKCFTSDTAFDLGNLIRNSFLKTHLPNLPRGKKGIVISITLFNGQNLFTATVGPDASPDNMAWVKAKHEVVRKFGKGSFLMGRYYSAKGVKIDNRPEWAAYGGAVPIHIEGVTVGPIGSVIVSGLTQENDHDLVVSSMRHIIAAQKPQETPSH